MKIFFLGLFAGSAITGLFSLLIWKKSQSKFIKQKQTKMEELTNKIELNYSEKNEEKDKEIKNLKITINQQNAEIKNLQSEYQRQNNLTKIMTNKIKIDFLGKIKDKDAEIEKLRELVDQQNEEIKNLQSEYQRQNDLIKMTINEAEPAFLLKIKDKNVEIAKLRELVDRQNIEIEDFKSEYKHQSDLTINENKSLDQAFSSSGDLPDQYRKLQQYLIDKKWQNADQETSKILFELSSSSQSYLNLTDYQNLPLRELAIIDGLWTYYSNGLFGFSAQHQTYLEVCKNNDFNPDQWRKIGDLLGWRKNQQWISSSQNLTISLDAPKGHFPFLTYWQGVWLGGFIDGQSDRFIALMSRFFDVFR